MQIEINSLAEAIKHKRCLLGLTQRKLASTLEVDYTYISKLENGRTIPSVELIERLEIVLQFEKGDLVQMCGFVSSELMELVEKVVKRKGELALKEKLLEILG